MDKQEVAQAAVVEAHDVQTVVDEAAPMENPALQMAQAVGPPQDKHPLFPLTQAV